MPDSPVEISPLAPIFGGEEVVAHFRDGSVAPVFVREFTIRNYDQFIKVADVETTLLETGCFLMTEGIRSPLTAAQVDALTVESSAELVEKSRALNLAPALAWAERQARVLRRLRPVLEKLNSN
jgi:hypothetical protein